MLGIEKVLVIEKRSRSACPVNGPRHCGDGASIKLVSSSRDLQSPRLPSPSWKSSLIHNDNRGNVDLIAACNIKW